MISVHEKMDTYFVAVKVFLRDKSKMLIVHDVYGVWELPGGRIRKEEFHVPIKDIIKRKMKEELGPHIQYELGKIQSTFRVERHEKGLNDQVVHIFAVGYEAKYLGGEIQLGDYHDEYKWVDIQSFKPEDCMTSGWLEGTQTYINKVRA